MELKNDRFFYRFWTRESGMSWMLLLLFSMHFIAIPLFGSYLSFMVILSVFWMLFLLAGIVSLAKDKKQALRISVIPFLFILFELISFFKKDDFILTIDFCLSVLSIFLLIVLVLAKVLEPGPVNKHRIVGSIVVYMLLVNLWSIMYLFIFNHIDGAFQMPDIKFEMNSKQANFLYFSYITITSTGFGEILPLHPLARSLVQLEVLTGVLYPVVLIGRLVADATFSRDKKLNS
ncbi:ion channel [Flavobacterium branchiicola]|uniref:Ion channel n=1 Tax=Flavobacterium branchiicola TaxID=1114875 RepID=A0ABV9PD75_9FLAO|nr:ion channel [Flavobacterium branchiicola]MBS7254551.1 two pore domain potassium channel family protein [Flavobacterium branchiicola]